MKNFFSLIIILFFTLFALETSARECQPEFGFKEGWLGGDAAFSVAIDKNITLWLFGDTFIGDTNSKTREGKKIISNTIGISSCNNSLINGQTSPDKNTWKINYFWKNQNTDNPQPYFYSKTENTRYWPLHGFLHNEKLYIALQQIRNTNDNDIFGFEGVGVDLAVISNPFLNPDKWSITYHNLVTGKTFFPGISFVKKDSYIYLFTVMDDKEYKKNHPMILTRILLDKLEDISANIEYLTKDKKWDKNLSADNALIVMEKGSTEMSVRYDENRKKWLAVYNKPEFFSNEIILRTAINIEGPWSEPVSIYKIPEMTLSNNNYDKDTFCYAAKEHQQFGSSNNLLITYACNSLSFTKLVNNMNIYVPKSVIFNLDEKQF